MVHKIDRTVYNLQDNPQAAAGSVADILTTLPAVYIDQRGSVSVYGATVAIYVDGKPAPQFRGVNIATALQAMSANTVVSIEVITNPGAEFRTSARTIINIVTRKAKGKALTGDLIVNGGPDARYNQTVIGSFGVGKWSFMGSAALRQNRWTYKQTSERDSLDAGGDVTSRLLEDEVTSRHLSSTALSGTATYDATDKDSLALAANITLQPAERRHDDKATVVDATTAETDTSVYGPDTTNSRSLTGTYKHKDQGEDGFTLQFTHAENDNLQDFHYDQADIVPLSADTLYRRGRFERDLIDTLTGDYVHTLAPDTQFKSGFDIESARDQVYVLASRIDDVIGTETLDPGLTSRFLTDNRLLSAYAQYQAPLGKWLVMGGLRLENELTRFTAARAGGYDQISDTELSPSVFAGRSLTADSKIRFSYSRHISRPRGNQLDPVPVQGDPYDLSIGNPNLRPSRDDAYEANYNYTTKPLSFDATAYFRDNQHTITDYAYYRDPGDLVLVSTPENAGHSTRDGINMSLDLHPSKTIGLDLSSDLYATSLSAPAGLFYIRQSITSYLSKVMVTWQETPADNLQANYVVSGRSLVAQGTASGFQTFILSYSHILTPKLKITATVADLFNSGQNKDYLRSPQLRLFVNTFSPGQYAYIGIDYKFGAASGR